MSDSDPNLQDNSQFFRQDEPLLTCCDFVMRYFGGTAMTDDLLSQFSVSDSGLTPEVFVQIVKHVGLISEIVHGSFARIFPLQFPCVAYMKGTQDLNPGKPVVLLSVENALDVRFFCPERNRIQGMNLEEFKKKCGTLFILLKSRHPVFASEALCPVRTSESGWLKKVICTHWKSTLGIFFATAGINLSAFLVPFLVMYLYDSVLLDQATTGVTSLALWIFLLLAFGFFLRTFRAIFLEKIGMQVEQNLYNAMLFRTLNSKLTYHSGSSGFLVGRMKGFESVRSFFTSGAVTWILDFPFIFLFFFAIYVLLGWIVLVPVTGFFLSLASVLITYRGMGKFWNAVGSSFAARHSLLVESVSSVETVKSLCAQSFVLEKWKTLTGYLVKNLGCAGMISAVGGNFSFLIQQLVTISLFVFAGLLFVKGQISIGMLIAIVILSVQVCMSLQECSTMLMRMRSFLHGVSEVNSLMGSSDALEGSVYPHCLTIERGEIHFQNVSFSYPRMGHEVLKQINFLIQPGEKVGIVGPVGTGKTTLGRLMIALYETQKGEILIDGVNIGAYPPQELRREIAFVSQEVELFSGSVRDNMLMGSPEAEEKMVVDALRLAGLEDFVRQHPLGLDLPVGERGKYLSAAQRHAVACARVFLTDPKVIFFDEPSMGMDIPSECHFVQNLRSILHPKQTLIVSTHRQTMLALVNRLIVLNDGKVIADGPRDEVLASLNRLVPNKQKVRTESQEDYPIL